MPCSFRRKGNFTMTRLNTPESLSHGHGHDTSRQMAHSLDFVFSNIAVLNVPNGTSALCLKICCANAAITTSIHKCVDSEVVWENESLSLSVRGKACLDAEAVITFLFQANLRPRGTAANPQRPRTEFTMLLTAALGYWRVNRKAPRSIKASSQLQ